MKRSEDSDSWDTIRWTSIYIIGVPEGEERKKGAANLFKEIMAGNFLYIGKETDI